MVKNIPHNFLRPKMTETIKAGRAFITTPQRELFSISYIFERYRVNTFAQLNFLHKCHVVTLSYILSGYNFTSSVLMSINLKT